MAVNEVRRHIASTGRTHRPAIQDRAICRASSSTILSTLRHVLSHIGYVSPPVATISSRHRRRIPQISNHVVGPCGSTRAISTGSSNPNSHPKSMSFRKRRRRRSLRNELHTSGPNVPESNATLVEERDQFFRDLVGRFSRTKCPRLCRMEILGKRAYLRSRTSGPRKACAFTTAKALYF